MLFKIGHLEKKALYYSLLKKVKQKFKHFT